MLLQISQKYLTPLHERELVHRDIKPQNIIISEVDDEKEYTLIDFGLLRENNSSATITGTFHGTLGYQRMKAVYEVEDDFYSLAKTAYFLLSGKHPELVVLAEYDEIEDRKKISALPIDDRLKKVMFKMLGHDVKNRYNEVSELISDLGKVQRKVRGQEIDIDLGSSRALTQLRESTQVPEALERKIKGLQMIFEEQYEGCFRYRNPLSEKFVADLDNVLVQLGYFKEGFPTGDDGLVEAYIRPRRDSEFVDVLRINSPGSDLEGYLSFFTAKGMEKGAYFLRPFRKNKEAFYEIPKLWVARAQEWGPAIATTIAFGTNSGSGVGEWVLSGVIGTVVLIMSAILTSRANYGLSKGVHKVNENNTRGYLTPDHSYAWGLLGVTLPHVVGKATYDVGNGLRKFNHATGGISDGDALHDALLPAPRFTYNGGNDE